MHNKTQNTANPELLVKAAITIIKNIIKGVTHAAKYFQKIVVFLKYFFTISFILSLL